MPPGIFVLTPSGWLSRRSCTGLCFRPVICGWRSWSRRWGIGNPLDKLLLWCFHYDPKERRYSLAAIALVRAGGTLTMLVWEHSLLPRGGDRRARVNG